MTEEKKEKLKVFLLGRKRSYQQVFNPESIFVKAVLKDLNHFCRGTKSTFHTDSRAHAVLEGRREVFLRIQEHLNLSHEDLWEQYGGKNE